MNRDIRTKLEEQRGESAAALDLFRRSMNQADKECRERRERQKQAHAKKIRQLMYGDETEDK